MQVNLTNPPTADQMDPSSMPLSPVVIHTPQSQTTQPIESISKPKPASNRSDLQDQRIKTLFLAILTTRYLNTHFFSFSRSHDLYKLGYLISKVFNEKLVIEETTYDSYIADNKPLSILNAYRVQRAISHSTSKGYCLSDLLTLIKLEESLKGVKIFPFSHVHHLNWNLSCISSAAKVQSHELGQLKHYTALQKLSLLYPQEHQFSQMVVPHLPDLSRTLTELCINFSNDYTFCLQPLIQLTGLKSFSLLLNDIYLEKNNNNWKVLSELTSLDSLSLTLEACRITDAGLNAMEGLKALRKLDVVYCKYIYAARLVRFADRLQHLHFHYQRFVPELGFRNEPLQGEDAYALGQFTALQSLSILGCRISDVALREINKLNNLQKLKLIYTQLMLPDLNQLNGLTVLRELEISPIEDATLDAQLWKNLPALQTVTISGGDYLTETFTRPYLLKHKNTD